METQTSNTRYEIAYHLTPDLDEVGVTKEIKDLTEFLTNQGATIILSEEPKKKHLSYPINHKQYSYFGFIEFSAPAEVIDSATVHLKLQPQFFRHVIIKKPELKEYRILGIARSSRNYPSAIPAQPTVTKPEAKPQTREQEEKMTQDLEEVLESL